MQLVHTLVNGFVRPLEALLGRGDLASGELHEVRQALEAYVLGVESASNVVGCPFVHGLVLLPGSRNPLYYYYYYYLQWKMP